MRLFDRFRRRSTGGPAAVRARLEGAMAKRRLRGWNPPLENINALVASGGPRLLARSRELVVTNGYAANACEAFAANLVGDGIKPSSLIGDAGLRDRVQRLWLAWTDEADADGLADFYGLQAMVAREMFVAGECFVRLRPRRAEDGVLVPLQLQLLQSEMLPFDLGNVLVVDLLTGSLESVTDLTLFGGANALAIESAPGTWEIVQAGAAELLAPGRYSLTRLLRGQRGTEHTMGNPALAGCRVVVLDATLAPLPIAEADLGLPWNWRIGPASRPVSDETYVAQVFTPAGVGLRPFSVAHVEQPWRKPRTPSDLTLRWARRSRALAADGWGGLEVPLAEELEAYEVEILDGATVKRVLSTTTTSAVYTTAQQTADWGAPLGSGDTLDIRIFQLSALVGRGAPKTVTLTF